MITFVKFFDLTSLNIAVKLKLQLIAKIKLNIMVKSND
jgi:hypothetical protein